MFRCERSLEIECAELIATIHFRRMWLKPTIEHSDNRLLIRSELYVIVQCDSRFSMKRLLHARDIVNMR